MTDPANQTAPAPQTLSPGNWKLWLPVLLFAVYWLDLVRLLSSQWEAREQYAYGWFVPFFAVILLLRRWLDRPNPLPAAAPGQWLVGPVGFLVLVVMGVLLPLRVIYEINPDWPLISWAFTFLLVGFTLYPFWLAGGRPWVRHFAFPVALILLAVVWPWRIENALTQDLMRVVAGLTVELLGWLGVPAVQQGNLIELSVGMVGVSEACSGIRSFQSSVMAGFLMGELYRLRLLPRAGLVLSGIALAFIFNVIRTLLLTWEVSKNGLASLKKWHDPAGMTIAVACFLVLWVVAVLLKSRWGKTPEAPAVRRPAVFPRKFLLVAGCWAVALLGLTDLWYRAHETNKQGVFYWTASFPTNNPTFENVELDETVRNILKSDVGYAGRWLTESDGANWSAYFFRWNPGPVRSIIAARLHRPDVCLPAAGLRQVANRGTAYYPAHDLQIPFSRYAYEAQGKTLYVFFCQWEDGTEAQGGLNSSKQAGRLEAAWRGRRSLGEQSLEFILQGYASMEDAEQALRQQLPGLIKVQNAGPAAVAGR